MQIHCRCKADVLGYASFGYIMVTPTVKSNSIPPLVFGYLHVENSTLGREKLHKYAAIKIHFLVQQKTNAYEAAILAGSSVLFADDSSRFF